MAVTTPIREATAPRLVDEHSVLLWQTCAYAEDLGDAARSGSRLAPAFDAMLGFLHYRLLPYLRDEERELPAGRLRDEHMTRLLLADHERLRADVDNVAASRTRALLALASDALVTRLDHHVRREQRWVADPTVGRDSGQSEDWALPLLLADHIDLDALPPEDLGSLVLGRLQRMRPGDTIRLRAGHDLHGLWRRHHRSSPDTHAWVYEVSGPAEWTVRVTRRADGAG